MKKTKFEILIFICMILLGLGCFLIATKNNQYNFFEDILSRYPEENIEMIQTAQRMILTFLR